MQVDYCACRKRSADCSNGRLLYINRRRQQSMKVYVAHLSDIHFKDDRENPALQRAQKLGRAIGTSIPSSVSLAVIVVTGDLAFKGVSDEYVIFGEFLQQVQTGIRETTSKIPVVLVPGNHDCDFSGDQTARNIVCSQAKDSLEATASVLDLLLSAQHAYQEYLKGLKSDLVVEHFGPLVSGAWLGEDSKLLVLSFNTAWISRRSETQGCLVMPVESLPVGALREAAGKADIVIAAFHHPYAWLNADLRRPFQSLVESLADLVLTGHEHDSGSLRVERSSSQSSLYVEGGVLQDSHDEGNSSFNVIHIDLSDRSFEVDSLSWSGEAYERIGEASTFPFVRDHVRMQSPFAFSPSFRAYLTEPDWVFFFEQGTRPTSLGDFYVSPDLREVSRKGRAVSEYRLAGDLTAYAVKNRRVLVLGDDQSGRSTLAKTVVRELADLGVAPLLLNRESLPPAPHSPRSTIEALLRAQFSDTSPEAYLQVEVGRRALVIDDWDLLPLRRKARSVFFSSLTQLFGLVVVFSREDVRLDELVKKGQGREPSVHSDSLLDYNQLEIQPFGHLKRSQLVRKWLACTRPDEDESFVNSSNRIEDSLTDLLGKNLVPAYPSFVLLLLQSLQAGRHTGVQSGMDGYLYDVLFLQRLRRHTNRLEEVDACLTYLAELSSFLQSRGWNTVARSELSEWHDDYKERYLLSVGGAEILEILTTARILRVGDGSVSFWHEAYRHYFLARFLRDRIRTDAARDQVRQLASSLHDEQSAAVLIFLAYMCKDDFVVDALLSAARSLLADFERADLVQHTAFVTGVDGLPKLELDEEASPGQNRERLLRERDNLERAREGASADGFEAEVVEPLKRMHAAQRTVRLLGQVARNFAASLEGPKKIELVGECCDLSFRVLRAVLASLEASRKDMALGLLQFYAEQHPELSLEERERTASGFLFTLTERACYGVLKHLSRSIGSNDLKLVFDRVFRETDLVTARFAEVAIKLDHVDGFPEKEVLALHAELQGSSFLGEYVLKHVVWNHFYMFYADHAVRQRVCTRLKIRLGTAVRNDRIKRIPATSGGGQS